MWNILTTRDLLGFWLRWCGVVWLALIWFGLGWLGSILYGQIWLGLVWFGWDSITHVHNLDRTNKQKNTHKKNIMTCWVAAQLKRKGSPATHIKPSLAMHCPVQNCAVLFCSGCEPPIRAEWKLIIKTGKFSLIISAARPSVTARLAWCSLLSANLS